MLTLDRPLHDLPAVRDLLLITGRLTPAHLTTVFRLAWSTGALLHLVGLQGREAGEDAALWRSACACGVLTEPHSAVDATREQLAALVHDTHAELLITAWPDLPALDVPVLLLPAQVRP